MQSGFALLILTSLCSFVLNTTILMINMIVIQSYGYWPISNQMCQFVAFVGNVEDRIYYNSNFVAVICRNVIIFKDLEYRICQRFYKLAIKGNSVMIPLIIFIWLYTILTIFLPLFYNDFKVGFTYGHCNIVFINQTSSFDLHFSYTIFCFIPFEIVALGTTIISYVLVKVKSLNPDKVVPNISVKFTLELVVIMILGLLIKLVLSNIPHFFAANIIDSAYVWLFTIFVSTSVWPTLKPAMVITIKDLFCRKPLNNGGEHALSVTFSSV